MPQPDHISVLGVPDPAGLDDDLKLIWAKCVDKLGFVPNVFSTYSLKPQRLRHFMQMYNDIMLAPSGLSKLEREMVAVVVSSANRCYYCLVAHGAAVRQLSGDPELGEMMALNYRVAKLDMRQRAMLDFAWKMTTTPWLVDESDREQLRMLGLSNDRYDAEPGIPCGGPRRRWRGSTCARRAGAGRPVCGGPHQEGAGEARRQTLKRNSSTSPSLTTYSLPSTRILPASLAPTSPLQAT